MKPRSLTGYVMLSRDPMDVMTARATEIYRKVYKIMAECLSDRDWAIYNHQIEFDRARGQPDKLRPLNNVQRGLVTNRLLSYLVTKKLNIFEHLAVIAVLVCVLDYDEDRSKIFSNPVFHIQTLLRLRRDCTKVVYIVTLPMLKVIGRMAALQILV